MKPVKLVRTYAETLLSNIHEFIVNDVSKLVKNKIVNGIEKRHQLGYIDTLNQALAHSIGIRTQENPKSPGILSSILPKNTLIPCSHQQEYTNPDGELVAYYIHETDDQYTSENDLIDCISHKIPRARRGELQIVVTMTIDKNGILNAHCTCERSEDVSKAINLLIDSNIFKEFVNRSKANQQFLPEYKKNEKDCARHMNHLNEMQCFSLED